MMIFVKYNTECFRCYEAILISVDRSNPEPPFTIASEDVAHIAFEMFGTLKTCPESSELYVLKQDHQQCHTLMC